MDDVGFLSISHLDGKTAVRRKVEIQTIGSTFFLVEEERRHGPYSFDFLHFISKNNKSTSYGYDEIDGWRITISGHMPDDLSALLPQTRVYGSWIDRFGLAKTSAAFISISAVALIVGLTAPQWLAPLVPQSLENKMGASLASNLEDKFCDTPDGKKALAKLTASMDDNPSDMQIEVVNISMLNAVALPGGKVFLFDGLIQEAKSTEEVAGVLGHEIGHVRERHVMEGLLRQLGLSLILGGINDNVGGVLGGALSSSYGRDAEREADAHSIEVMEKANISPLGAKGFFDKLSKMTNEDSEDNITSYMASHPLSSERAAEFEKSYDEDRKYQNPLTDAEWQSIRSMCKNDKDVKSGFEFDF